MSDAIISVERFTKRYGNLEAVKEVSFDVKRGEIFAPLVKIEAAGDRRVDLRVERPPLEERFLLAAVLFQWDARACQPTARSWPRCWSSCPMPWDYWRKRRWVETR
jgi:hypothetical protein